jgi:triacylglycerol lipase
MVIISSFFININRVRIVKAAAMDSQDPIIFIHGWTGTEGGFQSMKLFFFNDGWALENLQSFNFNDTWDYSSAGNILNAQGIKYWVDNILDFVGAEKVDIIAHSMGGLSSRYYIKFLGGSNKVDDFVCLGSPQHGVSGGSQVFHPNSTFLYSLNEGDETYGGILNDSLGFRIDPVGGRIYNSSHFLGNVNYTSIYSTGDTIAVPINTSILDGANNIEVGGVTHVNLISDETVYEIIKQSVYDDRPNENDNNLIPGYNLLLLGIVFILVFLKVRRKIAISN